MQLSLHGFGASLAEKQRESYGVGPAKSCRASNQWLQIASLNENSFSSLKKFYATGGDLQEVLQFVTYNLRPNLTTLNFLNFLTNCKFLN